MNLDSEISQDDLIKILDFVCQHKEKKITPVLIKQYLFPDLELTEVKRLIACLIYKRIEPITIVQTGVDISYLNYRNGLEEYVKSLRKMNKREKLHWIVEFLSIENEIHKRSSLNTDEISKAFSPKLSIYEVNALCEILIADGVVKDCPSKEVSIKNMVEVLIIRKTHDAYHTKKYLNEDNEISPRINQNTVTGDNVVIGDNYGIIKQTDNFVSADKSSDKPKWLKWVGWVLAALFSFSALLN